jgi:integrase
LLSFERLASESLDAITSDRISEYVTRRREIKGKRGRRLQVASLNRELQVLRRMFALAMEWGKVDRALPKVKMLPGERHRERVLTREEEEFYISSLSSEAMKHFADPSLLHDVATILIDCGLRPEECSRLRAENVVDGKIEVHFGKTENARRRIPMTSRVKAVVDMRLTSTSGQGWLFPAKTKSGHIEPSSLKKQHAAALTEAARLMRKEYNSEHVLEPFSLYTLRHTCLTRWAPHMDPWTLAYLAGHRDMNITKRYIHPQEHTIRNAMDRARSAQGGHSSGHTGQTTETAAVLETAVVN